MLCLSELITRYNYESMGKDEREWYNKVVLDVAKGEKTHTNKEECSKLATEFAEWVFYCNKCIAVSSYFSYFSVVGKHYGLNDARDSIHRPDQFLAWHRFTYFTRRNKNKKSKVWAFQMVFK